MTPTERLDLQIKVTLDNLKGKETILTGYSIEDDFDRYLISKIKNSQRVIMYIKNTNEYINTVIDKAVKLTEKEIEKLLDNLK